VARWLGDIREYFPSTVVQVMQADAIERLNLTRLLLEPEMLDAVEPDVHLVGTLLSLNRVMPDADQASRPAGGRQGGRRAGARIAQQTRPRVTARSTGPRGSTGPGTATSTGTARSGPTSSTTSRAPHDRAGAADRLRPAHHAVQRDVVLCVDQSGSMAASVVYSGVFAACSPRCAR
jgi:hypothetical protein